MTDSDRVLAVMKPGRFYSVAQLAALTALSRSRLHRVLAELAAAKRVRISVVGRAWVVERRSEK